MTSANLRKTSAKVKVFSTSIALVVITMTFPTHAQPLNEARAQQVDALFATVAKADTPGCVVSITRNGTTLYAKGYGRANLEDDALLTPDSVFYIASTSKQFTAASIALLVLDHKLRLDSRLGEFFPELPAYTHKITVNQLLHHTSGIRDYFELLDLAGNRADNDVINNRMVLQILQRQKALDFTPGDHFSYSNSNYILLAEIVRRVSGEALPEFARNQIFDPLQMQNTRFEADANEIVPHRVMGHTTRLDGSYKRAVKTIEAFGDGNLLTTVGDLARWDENFYSGLVGGSALRELLQQDGHVPITKDGKMMYGFGLMYETYRGLPMEHHGGNYDGFDTDLMRFPQQHFSVATLCNKGQTGAVRLSRRVADIYLADVMTPVAPNPPSDAVNAKAPSSSHVEVPIEPKSIDALVGSYVVEGSDSPTVISFMREDAQMFVLVNGQDRTQFFPYSSTDFFAKDVDAQLHFQAAANGKVVSLTLHQGSDLHAIRFSPPTRATLQKLVGTYYSDELQAAYQVEFDGDQLVAVNARGEHLALTAFGEDRFMLDNAETEAAFRRDANGKATTLRVSRDRVKNILFVRRAQR